MADEIWRQLVECKYQILRYGEARRQLPCGLQHVHRKTFESQPATDLFLGHGIGLHLHEEPYLGKTPILGHIDADAVIEENMVLGFEPLCYETGYGFGMQNKDMLLVTATGFGIVVELYRYRPASGHPMTIGVAGLGDRSGTGIQACSGKV